MLLAELFRQPANWKFDLRSALIGAVVALLLAGLIYRQREQIKQFAIRLWTPLVNLRNRMRASQEEHYIVALQEALKELLLFTPADPTLIFQPPTFKTLPPLPTLEDLQNNILFPEPLNIQFAHLADGYPRLVISGPQASGRTMALTMMVWQTARRAERRRPYERFPLWIDLAYWKSLAQTKTPSPVERLAQLAGLFMPEVLPKWLLTHLRNEPALILVDNWDVLPPAERYVVAQWMVETAQNLRDSCWLVAAGETGYGVLVENGFVPLEIVPPGGEKALMALYEGWARLLKKEQSPPAEDMLPTLSWAAAAGASPLELTMRIIVYLQTQQLPLRPIDVVDRLLDSAIPIPNLGEGQAELVEQARAITLEVLSRLAKRHRLEGRACSQQEVYDLIASLLPSGDAAFQKLESAIRRMLFDTHLLRQERKLWIPAHYIWDDFLTAWALEEDPVGPDMIKAHLNDPTWMLLIEFYAGLGDVSPLTKILFNEVTTYGNIESLYRLARWSSVAPDNIPWRKSLLKLLAQAFIDPDIDKPTRLRMGHAMAICAGEGARPFFIQMLRQPKVDIRCAALRGLGWSGSPQEMPLLERALRDANLEIRQSAVEALADFNTPAAARLLQTTMYEADELLLPSIAEALAKTTEGPQILKEAAKDESPMIRRTAAQGLSQLDQPWAGEILLTMVREDKEWIVRSAAELGLNAIKERTEGKIVAPAPLQVDRMEWLIVWAASQGTGVGVGQAAMHMLERAVKEADSANKILAALTLAHVGRESHLTLLEPLLEDQNVAVTQAAGYAIQRIQQRYAIYGG